MAAAVRRDAGEVGHGQVVEVLLGPQHARALVVDVQEVLQVGEGVGGAHLLDRGERQRQPVAAGEGEHLPRLERSEEHTYELQSLMRNSYAVFCLKKKTNTISV